MSLASWFSPLLLLPIVSFAILQSPRQARQIAKVASDGAASYLETEESDGRQAVVVDNHGSIEHAASRKHRTQRSGTTCGRIETGSGGGVSWAHPVVMNDGTKIGMGNTRKDRDLKFKNLPPYFMHGHYIRPASTLPGGHDWTWTIKFAAPAKVYVFVWSAGAMKQGDGSSRDLNALLDSSVEKDGWTQEKAENFHRSDSPSSTFKVWSKSFTGDESSVEIKHLQGPLLAGAVTSSCGTVTGCSGGGVDWHHPVLMEDSQPVNPENSKNTLVNVPPYMLGGHYIGSPEWPKGENWTWTIKFKPPVKLNIWVWSNVTGEPHVPSLTNKHPFNAGLDEAVEKAGWTSKPAEAFHRSDDAKNQLEVWSKVFHEGHETEIQPLNGILVAGVVSTEDV